jgi:hypothetical protein
MSIKSAFKALFGSEEPKAVAEPPVEASVSEITKDLVATIARLDARTQVLGTKISAAEAAIAAANEAKRLAFAEQTDAFTLSKKIQDIVTPSPAGAKPAVQAPAIEVVTATAGSSSTAGARLNGVT